MGDFALEMNWPDSNFLGDNSSRQTGIPIPRSLHTHPYSRTDFNDLNPASSRPDAPPNSLVTNFEMLSTQANSPYEQQRNALSPYGHNNSPFNPGMEMEYDIKPEPFDEMKGFAGLINVSSRFYPEDDLLDNVNFEDLLQPTEMDSETPCLDPQHSSPAAMAAVRPDDVLGRRNCDERVPFNRSFPSAISIPTRFEHKGQECNESSTFPPQGIGWKDPFLHISINNQAMPVYMKEEIGESSSKGHIFQSSPLQPIHEPVELPDYNNQEPLFSQLEPTTDSTLHELLTNSSISQTAHLNSPQNQISRVLENVSSQEYHVIGHSVPGGSTSFLKSSPTSFSRLSSSAPLHDSMDHIWRRREPRKHLISTGSLAEEMGDDACALSPLPHDLSIEEIDSEYDSEVENYDSDSDNDSTLSEEANPGCSKKERHFWQYNVQAKGPKGQRVNILQADTNPHKLDKITDPVFSPLCSVQGIKHSGKARRGDGNDLTPSPKKLVNIGDELSKLNRKITEMTPVSELPTTIRSKSRKEKNKLASRACRLKKKAQHEANKIKLYGLDAEHAGLLMLICRVKMELIRKVELGSMNMQSNYGSTGYSEGPISFGSPLSDPGATMQQQITGHIDKTIKKNSKRRIAGHTTEFVNRVIDYCRRGNPSGGLDELLRNYFTAPISDEIPENVPLHFNQELELFT